MVQAPRTPPRFKTISTHDRHGNCIIFSYDSCLRYTDEYLRYHPNGTLAERALHPDGQYYGHRYFYDTTGTLQRVYKARGSATQGLSIIMNRSGWPNTIARWHQGKKAGLECAFTPRGTLMFCYNYQSGKQHGRATYYTDGNVYVEANYRNGERHGRGFVYDPDTRLNHFLFSGPCDTSTCYWIQIGFSRAGAVNRLDIDPRIHPDTLRAAVLADTFRPRYPIAPHYIRIMDSIL